MPAGVAKDGDIGFIGLNSRDNPSSLAQGFVSKSINFRLDRGIATTRKGLQRKSIGALVGQTIYGVGSYLNSSGQEVIVVAVTDGIYTYNPQTETLSVKISFPVGETITTTDGVDVVSGVNEMFITRGHSKRPLKWDMATTIIAMPTSGAGAEFPNCAGLLYYANRFIAQGQYHGLGYTPTARSRDSVGVSNYLDPNHWDALDVFTFNEGGNDEVTAISPWTLNEFVVFMRSSIFYVNIGLGRYAYSDPLGTSSFTKTLVTDLGCMAKRSVVLAGGGIMFLSDYGVYFLQPQAVASSDAVRLLTISDPISAPIDDIIQRINKNYAHRAVATYWNNRYYLAVPIDGSADNNAVLVYNFILKAWESVDIYPTGFDVLNFVVAKKNNQRRLYAVDSDQGIFLTEELEWDEYSTSTGIPTIPCWLPTILAPLAFRPVNIPATLRTRRYTMGDVADKRFSSTEVEMTSVAGSRIVTTSMVANPDSDTVIDNFGFPATEDFTRKSPIRKIGSGMQLEFNIDNLRPSIKSAYVYGLVGRKNIQSKY